MYVRTKRKRIRPKRGYGNMAEVRRRRLWNIREERKRNTEAVCMGFSTSIGQRVGMEGSTHEESILRVSQDFGVRR